MDKTDDGLCQSTGVGDGKECLDDDKGNSEGMTNSIS